MGLLLRFALTLAILLTFFKASVSKKTKEHTAESFEPCHYCHWLFEQLRGSDTGSLAYLSNQVNATSLKFCEKYEETVEEQCIDFAKTYGGVWTAAISRRKHETPDEFCVSVSICQSPTYHRPFYTSRGFCYKCKEVAESGLVIDEDTPKETFHRGLAVFMCKTLKTEGRTYQDCIAEMFKALKKNAEDNPSKPLKPLRTCKLFGTCNDDPQSYPSKPSTGYFPGASEAERKRAKEQEESPYGPRYSSPQPHRTFKIPEIPPTPEGKHNRTARTRYAIHGEKKTRPSPAKYKKPVPKVEEPLEKEKRKKTRAGKRHKSMRKHRQKEEKMPAVVKPEITVPSPIPVHKPVLPHPAVEPEAEPVAPISPPVEVPAGIPEPSTEPTVESEEKPAEAVEAEEPLEQPAEVSEPLPEQSVELFHEPVQVSEPVMEPEESPEEGLEEPIEMLGPAPEPLPEAAEKMALGSEPAPFWKVGIPLWFHEQAVGCLVAPDYEPDYESDEFDLEYEFSYYSVDKTIWNELEMLDVDPVTQDVDAVKQESTEDSQSGSSISIGTASNDLLLQNKFGRFFPRGRVANNQHTSDGDQELEVEF